MPNLSIGKRRNTSSVSLYGHSAYTICLKSGGQVWIFWIHIGLNGFFWKVACGPRERINREFYSVGYMYGLRKAWAALVHPRYNITGPLVHIQLSFIFQQDLNLIALLGRSHNPNRPSKPKGPTSLRVQAQFLCPSVCPPLQNPRSCSAAGNRSSAHELPTDTTVLYWNQLLWVRTLFLILKSFSFIRSDTFLFFVLLSL